MGTWHDDDINNGTCQKSKLTERRKRNSNLSR